MKIPNRVSIRHRPAEIDHREEFGHWEGDTIVGERHKAGIHPEVEGVSCLVFAYKVSRIRAKVLGYQTPQKFLQLILCKVFGLRLEFRG